MKPDEYLNRQMNGGDRVSWKKYYKLLANDLDRKLVLGEITKSQYEKLTAGLSDQVKQTKKNVRLTRRSAP